MWRFVFKSLLHGRMLAADPHPGNYIFQEDGRVVFQEEFFGMPPEVRFVNRLQFGFYSVLARLNVEVDYAAVERAFLADGS